ncbi:MAG TPA: hypothetical protein VKX17_24285 [Planctomycetota bacterium]|nr:hypothetical protein [Planctomycetota bacterium]
MLAKVHHIASLRPGWNGPKSKTPSKEALRNAERLIELISTLEESSSETQLPDIGPMTDGGVAFEWAGSDSKGRELVIFIHPKPPLEFAAVDERNDYELSGETNTVEELLPNLKWVLES